ncbi:hypothetical protein [Streptomyces sp. NPDC003395]
MNDTEAMRAGLKALSEAEEASPSRVWAPVLPSGEGPTSTPGAGQMLVLPLDGPLGEALAYLARGTDGTLEETARKAILDAALVARADDIVFTHAVARHDA